MITINDIRRAMAGFQREARLPDYVLLTYGEWLALSTDKSIVTAQNMDSVGPDRIYGLPIVIEGTEQHERMQRSGKHALRPSAKESTK